MIRFRLIATVVLALATALGLAIRPASSGTTTSTFSPVTTIVRIPGPPRAEHARPWYYPILKLGPRVERRFACVLWHESRSTFLRPNRGDNSRYGSSGVFQMEPILWNAWAALAGVHVVVWRATLYQQAEVAATVYRNDGFGPSTWNDGC